MASIRQKPRTHFGYQFEFVSPEPFETSYRRAVLTLEAEHRSLATYPHGLVSPYSKENTLYSPRRHVDHIHQRAKSAHALRKQSQRLPAHLRQKSPWVPPTLSRGPSAAELEALKHARARAHPGQPNGQPKPSKATYPRADMLLPSKLSPSVTASASRASGWLCKELETLFHEPTPAGRPQEDVERMQEELTASFGGAPRAGPTQSTLHSTRSRLRPSDSGYFQRSQSASSLPSESPFPRGRERKPNFGGVGHVAFGGGPSADLAPKPREPERPWTSLFRPPAESVPEPRPTLTQSRPAYDLGAEIGKSIDPPHVLGWNYWIAPPGGSTAHFPNSLAPVGFKPPAFT